MQELLVNIHSYWRWLALLLILAVIVLGVMAATGSRRWDSSSDRIVFFYTLALDIQVVIGLVVWLLQQRWTTSSLYLSWLHPLLMLVAVGVAHVARARGRKAKTSQDKGRQVALFTFLSLVIIVIAIPFSAWPV